LCTVSPSGKYDPTVTARQFLGLHPPPNATVALYLFAYRVLDGSLQPLIRDHRAVRSLSDVEEVSGELHSGTWDLFTPGQAQWQGLPNYNTPAFCIASNVTRFRSTSCRMNASEGGATARPDQTI
jgi:hypothetical protein